MPCNKKAERTCYAFLTALGNKKRKIEFKVDDHDDFTGNLIKDSWVEMKHSSIQFVLVTCQQRNKKNKQTDLFSA